MHNLTDEIFRIAIEIGGVTEGQLDGLLKILKRLHYTDERWQTSVTTDIDVLASVEGEVCFYRKTGQGVNLLSIDEEGDLLLNFTGYKEGFATERHTYPNIDFKKVIYDFLSH